MSHLALKPIKDPLSYTHLHAVNSAAVIKSGFEKSRSFCCASERLDSYLKNNNKRELNSASVSNEAVEMNLSHGT